jgi:hypothetical protein
MVDENTPAQTKVDQSPRELIDRLCAERGEDFASLSRLIGRNAAYVQQFVRRGTPRRLPERERRLLARHFGVAEHLLGGEEDALGAVGFVVPMALEAGEQEPGGLAFAAGWLRDFDPAGSERLRRLRVSGEAMAPTLCAGDELLVDLDLGSSLVDGLYVLRIEGAVQVRRLAFHPVRPEVTVQTDNPAFVDWPGLKPDELDVVARVVWAGRRLV